MSAPAYWLLWGVFRVVFRTLFGLRVTGADRVPRRGGLLVAANHASYLDIPVLGSSLSRRAYYLGRQDLFGIPGFRWLFRWLGWIPIRHDRLSREGFHKAVSLIRAGKVVVIYPEGTRSVDGALKPGKQGIGVIVAETGCRVLPVFLGGTHDVLPPGAMMLRFRPLRVVIGEPMDLTAEAAPEKHKEFYRHVSRTVMARIAELGHVSPPAVHREGLDRRPAARPLNAE